MAQYSIQLMTIIEQATQYKNDLSIKEKIELGRQAFFKDIDYEIFNESYRKTFETHFIRNFYTSEIGFETEGLFKLKLETWLQINMPYFNKLFETELLEFDPLKNINVEITHEKTKDTSNQTTQNTTQNSQDTSSSENTSNSNTDSNTNSENHQLNIHSNTPDSRLQIISNSGVIEYASTLDENKNTDSGNTSTTSDIESNTISNSNSDIVGSLTGENVGNELENYITKKSGKEGTQSYQSLIEELRRTFLRIENQIFNEMKQELFMIIY